MNQESEKIWGCSGDIPTLRIVSTSQKAKKISGSSQKKEMNENFYAIPRNRLALDFSLSDSKSRIHLRMMSVCLGFMAYQP